MENSSRDHRPFSRGASTNQHLVSGWRISEGLLVFVCMFICSFVLWIMSWHQKAIAFEGHLFTRSKSTLILLDIILHTAKIMQNLDSEKRSSYEGLFLVGGLLRMPRSAMNVTLPWSPLKLASFEPQYSPSHEELFRNARDWIISMSSERFGVFDDMLTRLWKQESPPCVSFLTRGEQVLDIKHLAY